MIKRYNILWIDDEYKAWGGGFIDAAHLEGFDISPFQTSGEGMEFLRQNLNEIDAVMLDAKVFKESTNDLATEKGLTASLLEIAKLSGQNKGKNIPHVVFTGQPDLESDTVFADRMDGIPIFSKSGDNKLMFRKLRELIGDSPEASVRNQFRTTYEACRKGGIGLACWSLLAPVLASVCGGPLPATEPYNDVRKALEWVIRYLHRHSVIHERLVDREGRVNLQGTSLFLAGKPAKYNSTSDSVSARRAILPSLLAESLKFVLDVTQPGSHTEEPENAEHSKPSIVRVEEHAPNHHLLQIVALMTTDIIQWAFSYVRANPDPAVHRALWNNDTSESVFSEEQDIICEIISVTPGQYFAKPLDVSLPGRENVRIPRKLVNAEGLEKGTRVRVTAKKEDPSADHWLANSVKRQA